MEDIVILIGTACIHWATFISGLALKFQVQWEMDQLGPLLVPASQAVLCQSRQWAVRALGREEETSAWL